MIVRSLAVLLLSFCNLACAKEPFEQVYAGYNGPDSSTTAYFQDEQSFRASWAAAALKPQDLDLILKRVDFNSQVVVLSAVGGRKAVTGVKLGNVERMGGSLSALVLVGVADTTCPGPRPDSYPFVIGIAEKPEGFDNLPNYFHQNFPDECKPVISGTATAAP